MSEPSEAPRSAAHVLRDLIALASAEVVAKVAGFVAFAALARVLSPEAYGGVELAVQIALALTMFVDFGLGPIGARRVASAPHDAARVAGEIATLRIALAVVAYGAAYAIAGRLAVSEEIRSLVRVVSLSVFAAPFVSSWLFQGLGRMRWVAGGQLLRMCVFAGLVLGFVHGDAQLARVGAAELTAMLALAGWYRLGEARSVGSRPLGAPLPRLRALAIEALPVGASRVTAALQQYAPTLLVAQLAGPADLAWFAAAHRLVTSLQAFVEIHLFNLYPQLVRAAERGAEAIPEAAATSLRVSAWLGCGVALALGAVAAPLLGLVFGSAFEAGANALALAAFSLPLALVGGHARFALLAAGRQRGELAAALAGAAVTLASAWAAVPLHGAAGAAASLAVGAATTWWAAHAIAHRHGIRMPIAPSVRALAVALPLALASSRVPPGWELAGGASLLLAFGASAFALERGLARELARLAAGALRR